MTKVEIKKSIVETIKCSATSDGTVTYTYTKGKATVNNYYLTKEGNDFYLGRDNIGSILHTNNSDTSYYVEDLPKDNDGTASIHEDFQKFCKSIVESCYPSKSHKLVTVTK